MKKFIFTANVIAIVALVPAIFLGYLRNDTVNKDKKVNTEVAKDVTHGQEDATSINLIKTF
jgi:hypothetical protein